MVQADFSKINNGKCDYHRQDGNNAITYLPTSVSRNKFYIYHQIDTEFRMPSLISNGFLDYELPQESCNRTEENMKMQNKVMIAIQ